MLVFSGASILCKGLKSFVFIPDTRMKIIVCCHISGSRDDGQQGCQGEDQAVHRHDVLRHLLILKFAVEK